MNVLNDIRYGFRLLLRRPAFAVVAVLTLAIGIGTNTAIFTVFDRVILRAVPFPEPDRLVVVWETNPALPVPVMVASPPTLHDWHDAQSVVHGDRRVPLAERHPRRRRAGADSRRDRDRLAAARARHAAGAWAGCSLMKRTGQTRGPVVLISDVLWRRRFGADPRCSGVPCPLTACRTRSSA